MTPSQDPLRDILQLLDTAGLTPGNIISSRKPMRQLITDIKEKLTASLRAYMLERDKYFYRQGYERAKSEKGE